MTGSGRLSRFIRGRVFLRDFAVLAGGQVVSRLVGFVAFAGLARTLRLQDYGLVEYVVGLSVFFGAVVESGLGAVGVRRIARRPEDLPSIAAQIPLARLAIALVSVPLMVLVATPAVHGTVGRGLVWLYALSLLAAPWRQDWLLQAAERITEVAVAQILRAAIFALVVFTLVATSDDLLRVGWAEIAGVTAMSLFYLAIQHARITRWRLRAPLTGLPNLAAEGSVIGLGSVLWSANQYAPLLLLAYFAGDEKTAWFAAASRVIASVLAFSNLYYFNLYPAIARATATNRDELAAILSASFRVLAWGGTLAALSLTVLAGPLSTLAFGSQFGQAAPVLMIVAWAVPITLLSGHARWSLIAAGHETRVVYAQLAGSISIAAIGVPSILLFGDRGAALAAVAASLAVWLASHAFASLSDVRPPSFGLAARPALLALAVIGAVHILPRPLEPWPAVLGMALFAGTAPLFDRRILPDLKRLGDVRRRMSVETTAAV